MATEVPQRVEALRGLGQEEDPERLPVQLRRLSRSGWLTDPDIALPALIAVGIWQGLGTKMVRYLGGLQTISPDLLEAARLDGASTWQTFWHVSWPGLAPVQTFVLITSIAGSFQAFDLVYVMTRGGPINSTRVLSV